MGWLLDTNIVSQLAPGRDGGSKAPPHLAAWLRHNSEGLFLSALSVVEITAGIHKLRRAGAERRASDLDAWFDRIVALYGDKILPLDAKVGKVAGRLADEARAGGRNPGLADILIAATAQAHGYGLATDNLKHFAPLNLAVPLFNPLDAAP
jgi:predicted nucleic acid-binding protein